MSPRWYDERSVRGRHVPGWPLGVVIPPTPEQRQSMMMLRALHDDAFVGAQDETGVLRVVALDGTSAAARPGERWTVTGYAIDTDGLIVHLPAHEPYTRPSEDETDHAAA